MANTKWIKDVQKSIYTHTKHIYTPCTVKILMYLTAKEHFKWIPWKFVRSEDSSRARSAEQQKHEKCICKSLCESVMYIAAVVIYVVPSHKYTTFCRCSFLCVPFFAFIRKMICRLTCGSCIHSTCSNNNSYSTRKFIHISRYVLRNLFGYTRKKLTCARYVCDVCAQQSMNRQSTRARFHSNYVMRFIICKISFVCTTATQT